ncbi:MAG: DUF1080 domain-containing protein [Oscillospiraceae bacterium]|nr:DUF1080 domain-containing protein [Oscillospiraceae bacterium]
MKQRRIGRKGRAAPVVPVLALLLFIAVMVTVPVAFSKYLAKGEGSAGVRIAKWDPKATVSPETILFRDITPMYYDEPNGSTAAVHRLSGVFNLGYTFDNRGTEVKTRYMMVPPSELAPGGVGNPLLPYAFADRPTAPDPWKWPVATLQPDAGPVAGFDAYDPGNPAKTYNAKWRRWYANDVRIDTSKGNNGLVWELDFEDMSGTGLAANHANLSGNDNTPASFHTLFSKNGGGGNVYIPSYASDAWIKNGSFRGITMNGNYLAFGTQANGSGHDHHMRLVLFNRPANVGNHWAMEFDMKFGYADYGHAVREGHLFHFVIWDSSATHTNSSSPAVTANHYLFGFRKNVSDANNQNGWFYVTGDTYYAYSFTGLHAQQSGGHYAGMSINGSLGNEPNFLLARRQYGRRVDTNSRFFNEGEWVHVRVERSGSRFSMYVNGELAIQYNNLSTSDANYKIGFQEMRNTVGVDNIKMWALKDMGDNADYGVIPPSARGMYRQVDINAVQAD